MTRVPGRVIVVLALALYPGIGLAVPLSLAWPTIWLVDANIFGVTFAALISIGWLVARVEAANRRHLLDWTTDMRHLSAEEFEWFVGEVFRREGWNVTETGRPDRADGNVDLILETRSERRLVQCKRWWSRRVGVDEIRFLAGTLARERMSTDMGVFVTFSDFTEEARREAKTMGMELVDGRNLHARAEKARRPEPCPICHAPMVLARSQHGWWFRCNAGECTGKRNLDREPALAVELLTVRPWVS